MSCLEEYEMIETRIIDYEHKADINLPNQPFSLFGRMIPSYMNGTWSYTTEISANETKMCFPDEAYDYEAMAENSTFIGAYDHNICIGLAIMQAGFFKYMYLYDLKVNQEYRQKGVAKRLIDRAKETALASGYNGIFTQAQDNNLGACLFYIKAGFYIGGVDTNVYKGTKQEGKADIIFYCDCVM